MKTKMRIFFLLLLSVLVAMTDSSFGQRGFGMSEKKLVEKFKRSDVRFQNGKEYFNKEKYDKAEKELKTCVELMPEHADAYFLLAQIDLKKGEFNQALAEIEKAESNYEFIGQFYAYTQELRLEQLRDDKSRLGSELEAYRDKLAKATTDEERQRIQALLNQTQAQLSSINSRLNEPLPDVLVIPGDYYYIHGNILFKLQKFQEAHDRYLEAIKIDPKHPGAYNNVINLCYMAKNYDEALKFVNQAEVNGVPLNPKLKEAVLKAAGKSSFS
jgi:pentatricopeptide repeat protein